MTVRRKTLEQTMCDLLATYLQSELDAALGAGVVPVEPEWPAPDSPLPDGAGTRPKRSVTLVMVGERRDVRLQESLLSVEPGSVSGSFNCRYRVKACTQPIQLDIWAQTMPEADEIASVLEDSLHRGPKYTLGDPLGELVRDGPLLKFADDDPRYYGFVDFTFDGPSRDSSLVREREGRIMMSGSADGILTVDAESPKLALVKLQMALDGANAEFHYENTAGQFRLTEAIV